MSEYFSELCLAMNWLSAQGDTIFIGQGVGQPGTTMHDTMPGVLERQRIEFPVAEELQMGASIGMSLNGIRPICIFPRWNFMLRAADQIVNHLDRLPLYSEYKPRVIIRTAVPSTVPFNPGEQHSDDFGGAFSLLVKTIPIVKLHHAEDILPAYQAAYASDTSTILVELTDKYKDERAHAA